MRVDFCMFLDADGNHIYVNPLHVCYFQSHRVDEEQIEATNIILDDMRSIVVLGSPREVEERLNVEG
jgi:hypothetical protein